MKRRIAAGCLAVTLAALPAVAQPLRVETGVAQLFVDDFLIAEQEDLVRTLHQPVKDHGGNAPVITLPADTFGGFGFTLEANGSIVYDTRLGQYVMFALGYSSAMGQERERSWEKARLYLRHALGPD